MHVKALLRKWKFQWLPLAGAVYGWTWLTAVMFHSAPPCKQYDKRKPAYRTIPATRWWSWRAGWTLGGCAWRSGRRSADSSARRWRPPPRRRPTSAARRDDQAATLSRPSPAQCWCRPSQSTSSEFAADLSAVRTRKFIQISARVGISRAVKNAHLTHSSLPVVFGLWNEQIEIRR